MYTIQTDVPLPNDILGKDGTITRPVSGQRLYPLHEMKIGNCFKVPSGKAIALRGSIGNYNKALKAKGVKTKTFVIRKLNKREHGCWMTGYNGKHNTAVLLRQNGRVI